MYLKKSTNSKTGRTYLSMVHNYRDKEKGCSRTKTIESFGYLDELEKVYDDPIAHFTAVVDEQNRKNELEDAEYSIIAKKNQLLPKNTMNRRNYGYIIILKVFYWLGIERFLSNKQQRDTKIEFNCSLILKFLLISRILSPGSKKKAFDEKGRYFEFENKKSFQLVDVYRCLTYLSNYEKQIQQLIYKNISERYQRNMDCVYYDVTNYYFEIDEEDDLFMLI